MLITVRTEGRPGLASRAFLILCFVVTLFRCLAPAAAVNCPGDCDSDLKTSVSEVVACVNAALGRTSCEDCAPCEACDLDQDGRVRVNELVAGVRVALDDFSLVKVEGVCRQPCKANPCGAGGLEPCDDGTVVVWRCDPASGCRNAATTGEMEGGQFCVVLCQLGASDISFEAPPAQETRTTYRTYLPGPAGTKPSDQRPSCTPDGQGEGLSSIGISISPNSEAVSRLVDGIGLPNLDAVGLNDIAAAVEHANRDIDFAGRNPAAAAEIATTQAQEDPLVMAAIEASQAVTLRVGSAADRPDQTVSIDVTLNTGGAPVAGTQNDLQFEPETPVRATAGGRPDCSVNTVIGKESSSFAFRPPGCTPGIDCIGIRALIFSLENIDAIPNRSVLFTCQIAIAANATGSYALTCSSARAAPPDGQDYPVPCSNGGVLVTR